MQQTRKLLDWITSAGGYADQHATSFIRYAASGAATFVIDFSLLWLLTDTFGIYYLFSAALAFLVSASVNYSIIHHWAFKDSSQTLTRGFVYYIVVATIGLVLTVLLMAFVVEILELHYLLARVIVALFVGIWTFLVNARFNFRTL